MSTPYAPWEPHFLNKAGMPSDFSDVNPFPVDIDAAFHEKLLDSVHDGVYFVDPHRKILYWNKGAENLTGYTAQEVVGRSCFANILMHVNDAGCSLCLAGCPLAKTIADGSRREMEVYLRHKLGHRVAVSVRAAPVTDRQGNIIGAVEVFSDATAKRHIERRVGELENLVYLDSMTGVPNRRYVELKVRQAIQEVEQFNRKIGLIMVDVDNFKKVNDEHGHSVGDEVLKVVAKTLEHELRSGNVVGRWGGEEFLAIVAGTTHSGLRAYAERCRERIAGKVIPLPSGSLHLTVSMGVTLILPQDSELTAIERADRMMYRSKAQGRNRVTLG